MNAIEKLYYSLGQLAYVMAKADGEIQTEEKKKLHDLVMDATKDHNLDFNYSEIIFWLLDKEDQDSKTVYHLAIDNFRSLKHFFDDELKVKFINSLQQIADAYPPFSIEEELFMDKIRREFKNL